VAKVLDRLSFGLTYRTGPEAWSDLHAGGLFFYVVYRECLRFGSRGRVRRWCEVIDDSRPLDNEVEVLRADRSEGTYGLNDRGYLVVSFPDLILTGYPCEQASDLLAFHAFRPGTGVSFSLVYRRGRPRSRRRRGN
jgi:hypothetical protein